MVIEIDFNSDEAIYVQLMNQIILGIATSRLQEGDPLPSVRQLADTIGINMHTVNKAYSLLRQEGFVTIDRRRGAIIAVDENKIKAMEEMKENLIVALAKGCCRNVSREEVHGLIDEIYDEYGIDQNRLKICEDSSPVSCGQTGGTNYAGQIYQTGVAGIETGKSHRTVMETFIYRHRTYTCRIAEGERRHCWKDSGRIWC